MTEMTIGIDLGTTNSAVAVVQDGEPRILSKGDQKIIPSVVGYSKDSGWLVGRPALNQYTFDSDNTVRSIKRKMGSSECVTLGGKALTAVVGIINEPTAAALAYGLNQEEDQMALVYD